MVLLFNIWNQLILTEVWNLLHHASINLFIKVLFSCQLNPILIKLFNIDNLHFLNKKLFQEFNDSFKVAINRLKLLSDPDSDNSMHIDNLLISIINPINLTLKITSNNISNIILRFNAFLIIYQINSCSSHQLMF